MLSKLVINNCELFRNLGEYPLGKKLTLKSYNTQFIIVSKQFINNINAFDLCVLNVIYTFFEFDQKQFSIDDIVKLLSFGNTKRATPIIAHEIVSSINKLKMFAICIESETIKINRKGLLLPIKDAVYKSKNNKIISGYMFAYEPPLYTYSKNIKQLITIDLTKVTFKKKNFNKELVVIRFYLLQRISNIKNKKNEVNNKNILVSGIYKILGYLNNPDIPNDNAWRKKKVYINDIIIATLADLVDSKFISDFKQNVGFNKERISYSIVYDST